MQQRFAEHMERLEAEYDRLLDRMREVEDMIAEHLVDLSDIEQAIIVERYMRDKSWRQIEREYDYTEDGIFTIHSRAIKNYPKCKVHSKTQFLCVIMVVLKISTAIDNRPRVWYNNSAFPFGGANGTEERRRR